jgi:hypothetical protein
MSLQNKFYYKNTINNLYFQLYPSLSLSSPLFPNFPSKYFFEAPEHERVVTDYLQIFLFQVRTLIVAERMATKMVQKR